MNAQNRCFIFPTVMVLTLNSYLHCTITLTEATDFPAPFSAVHKYSPSCALLIFLSDSTGPATKFSSRSPDFDHVILGGGVPVPLQ